MAARVSIHAAECQDLKTLPPACALACRSPTSLALGFQRAKAQAGGCPPFTPAGWRPTQLHPDGAGVPSLPAHPRRLGVVAGADLRLESATCLLRWPAPGFSRAHQPAHSPLPGFLPAGLGRWHCEVARRGRAATCPPEPIQHTCICPDYRAGLRFWSGCATAHCCTCALLRGVAANHNAAAIRLSSHQQPRARSVFRCFGGCGVLDFVADHLVPLPIRPRAGHGLNDTDRRATSQADLRLFFPIGSPRSIASAVRR